jgi:hypothetical protein
MRVITTCYDPPKTKCKMHARSSLQPTKLGFGLFLLSKTTRLCPFTKPQTFKSVKKPDKKSTPQGAFPEHPFL